MQIEYTGRQMEITPGLRRYTEERLRKLTRLLRDRYGIHIILTAEKHRRMAEITLTFRNHTLVGIQETTDPRTSINGALDKLERQAVRLLARRRAKKRRPKPTAAILLNILGSERVDHEEHRVLERERIPIKPLTMDDAIESLDASPRGLVVFRNSETERVNVIYRRSDGNLGLIEPEP
ncbi:MAG: ribosome-associated translation inhibitor RaiA [Acidobacteria bacterium]|nr:ribosome-associated translation inhibitor RaiA [Acidobacteriota bacterium]